MKISEVTAANYRKYDNNYNNVNFKGFIPKKSIIRRMDIQKAREDVVNAINFNFSYDAVRRVNINDNIGRNKMLLTLSNKLKAQETAEKTEFNAPEILGRISKILEPDNEAQKLILEDKNFTVFQFEELTRFLHDKKNIELTKKLFGIRNEREKVIDFSKVLKGIFELNMAQKLNKNLDKFKSYIILNVNDENFVQNLDKELRAAMPSFDYKKLDKIIDIKKRRLFSPILEKISDKVLLNGNIKSIDLFTKGYTSQIINYMSDLTPEDFKFFEYFISTSNSKNITTRINYLNETISHTSKNQPFNEVKVLFEKIDSDKKIQKIVDAVTSSNEKLQNISAKELMFYIDKFGSDVLAENSSNFVNILELSSKEHPDEIAEIIRKNIRNKYYTTTEAVKRIKESERYSKGPSEFFAKVKRRVGVLFEKFSGPSLPAKKLNDIKFADYNILGTKNVNNVIEFVENVDKANVAEKVADIAVKTEEQPVKPILNKKIVREYKPKNSRINARKLKIFGEAQEIIKSRMKSAKQIEEQARDYSLTATKMRNKYLNKMFDYVADVRKAENLQGKKRHSVSNYDVLELYQKIRGYNEKEFRNMLKARKENGERMYSFDEINKMLDNSIREHFRILREKQAAAKEARRLKNMPAAAVI